MANYIELLDTIFSRCSSVVWANPSYFVGRQHYGGIAVEMQQFLVQSDTVARPITTRRAGYTLVTTI